MKAWLKSLLFGTLVVGLMVSCGKEEEPRGAGGEEPHASNLLATEYEMAVNLCVSQKKSMSLDFMSLDSAQSCAGMRFLTGNFVRKDEQKAASIFLEACTASKDAMSCHYLGDLYQKGVGVAKELARELKYQEWACARGCGRGCFALAIKYKNGAGVARDLSKASEYVEKACSRNDDLAKYHRDLSRAEQEAAKGEPAQTAVAYEQGCKSGDAKQCASLATMFFLGQGIDVDLEKAAQHYRRACVKGDGLSCSILGSMHLSGRGAVRLPVRGMELLEQGCLQGHTRNCHIVGLKFRSGCIGEPDPERMLKFVNSVCVKKDGNEKDACLLLLRMNVWSRPAEPKRAMKIFERDCGSKSATAAESCAQAGQLISGDDAKLKFYRKACSGESGRGCHGLGLMHKYGQQVPKDAKKAAELFEQACTAQSYMGCSSLSAAYEHGNGVAKDLLRAGLAYERICKITKEHGCIEKAAALWGRACNAGSAQGCHKEADVHMAKHELYDKEGAALYCYEKAGRSYGVKCLEGDEAACQAQSLVYAKADEIAGKLKDRIPRLEKKCARGDAGPCFSLGVMNTTGRGLPQNKEKGAQLLRKACPENGRLDPAFCTGKEPRK